MQKLNLEGGLDNAEPEAWEERDADAEAWFPKKF